MRPRFSDVVATATQITLPVATSDLALNNLDDVIPDDAIEGGTVYWDRDLAFYYADYARAPAAWSIFGAAGFADSTWVVATINAPEPFSVVIIGMVLCTGGGFWLARRGKRV